ncbi:MAG TPA: hypothetical protein PLG99_14170, partial [Kaistiaceae bacterium]|nr:hypothetical protein [Kaistiaceae bacterium]
MSGAEAAAAIIDGAWERIADRRRQLADPKIGEPRDGVMPGQWQPDETGLPPDCPIQVLGRNGMVTYIVDVLGQLCELKPSDANKKTFIAIFAGRDLYLHWAWPRWGEARAGKDGEKKPPKVNSFDADWLWATISAAAAKKGLWDTVERVRGRGAWRGADGSLVYHGGDGLYSGGRKHPTGEYGEFFYPRRPKLPAPFPATNEATRNPAPEILAAFRSWNWERPDIDPIMLLGWLAVAYLTGALGWRPHVILTGDAATGKSTLQQMIRDIIGSALLKFEDATAPGLYSAIDRDTLSISLDEQEGSGDRILTIIEMARISASGGVKARGSADHKGRVFNSSSPFLMSMIRPPAMQNQDHSRFAMLQLGELSGETVAPVLAEIDSIGPLLLRRLIDGWRYFERAFGHFAVALKAGGHDFRGQNTYGTLLAGAWTLLGDEGWEAAGFDVERYDEWAERMSIERLGIKEDRRADWLRCLDRVLAGRSPTWHGGQRVTVAQYFDGLANNHVDVTQ